MAEIDLHTQLASYSVLESTQPSQKALADFLSYTKKNRSSGKKKNREKEVIFVGGELSVGKSYLTSQLLDFLQQRGATPAFIHWDVIEQVLRGQSELMTSSGDPYTSEELAHVQRYISTALKNWLEASPQSSIIVEFPLGVSLLVDDYLEQLRPYGSSVVRNLVYEEDPFQSGIRENITIKAIGIIPGPSLQILAYYRHAILSASSLKDANEVNDMFGFNRFSTSHEWESKRDGGSIAQIAVARKNTKILADKLVARFSLDHFFNKPVIFSSEDLADLKVIEHLTEEPFISLMTQQLAIRHFSLEILRNELCFPTTRYRNIRRKDLRSVDAGMMIINNPKLNIRNIPAVKNLIADINKQERRKQDET